MHIATKDIKQFNFYGKQNITMIWNMHWKKNPIATTGILVMAAGFFFLLSGCKGHKTSKKL